MNLVYGEIVEVFHGAELRLGRVRIGKALKEVSLDLLTNPAPGETVLLCEGLALSKVDSRIPTEVNYVPGHSR